MGETVTVSWQGEHVDGCLIEASTGAMESGTSGEIDVTVNDLVYIVARCDPQMVQTTAAISLAPRCENTIPLSGHNGISYQDGQVNVTVEAPDCASLEFGGIFDQHVAGLSRLQRVGEQLNFFKAGFTGLSFPNLESVSPLTGYVVFDYQNGSGSPGDPWFERINFDSFYISLPRFESELDLLAARCGRYDVPRVTQASLHLASGQAGCRSMINFGTVELSSVLLSRSQFARAPLITGTVSGVSGDVWIKDNELLPHAEAEAFLDQLGTINGTVTICGNLDDAPCVP